MKISIRTVCFVILGVVLAAVSASAQAKRWQLAPPLNGGMAASQPVAADSKLATSAPKKLNPEQSRYTWLELDPLGTGKGYCYADAHAINDFDQVVVDWSDPSDCNILHASLWDKGNWKLLDYAVDPNCAEPASYLTSINIWGFAFGTYWSGCPYEPAGGVNVKSTHWTLLPDIPGYPYNQGFSMNDFGVAVGVDANLDMTVFQHWIWDGHKYIFLSFPSDWDVNTWWAGPLFINDWGQIAGEYFDKTQKRERGYLQEGAKITAFDAPGNPDGTYVNGMTNTGYLLLIGSFSDPNSPYYPNTSFLYKQGKFTALPNPPVQNPVWVTVFGVNDRGDLVGRWLDTNNNMHTYFALRH